MRITQAQRVGVAKPDPVFDDLLADPRNEVRPPPTSIPLSTLRQAADERLALAPRRDVHSSDDITLQNDGWSVAARLYRPSSAADLPVILFLHGGGWVWGSLESHDSLCRSLLLDSGCAVLAVEYRLSPEAPFPAALQDASGALDWIAKEGAAHGLDPNRVALCGDSSGGNLALATALSATAPLRALGLFYPPLDPTCASASQTSYATDHLLSREGMRWFWQQYLGDSYDKPPPSAALMQRDLSGLPPVSIGLAECDILHDEGVVLAERLEAAGNPVSLRVYPGQIHAFVSLPHVTPAAEVAIREMAEDMRTHLFANTGQQNL